jgi:HEPN domain-containing protein
MDNNTNYAKAWFNYAQNDFEAAEILFKQIKPKYEIICYHCQQSAEKMLKGYLAMQNDKLLKTHDLVVLCEAASKYEINFNQILNTCSDLTIFASEVRYPNSFEIDDYHTRKALQDSKSIMTFVNNIITQ